jgi:hypothetical protein
MAAWVVGQYDHGVYAQRERLEKREKKIKSRGRKKK